MKRGPVLAGTSNSSCWHVKTYFCFTFCDLAICPFAFAANLPSLSHTRVPWITSPSYSTTILTPQSSLCHDIFHWGLPAPPSLLPQFMAFWCAKSSTIPTIEDHCQVEGGGGEGVILDSIPVCSHHSLGSSDWDISSRPLKNRKLKIVPQPDVLKGTTNSLPSQTCIFLVKTRHNGCQDMHATVTCYCRMLSNSFSSPNWEEKSVSREHTAMAGSFHLYTEPEASIEGTRGTAGVCHCAVMTSVDHF